MTEWMAIRELEDYIELPFGVSISDETCKMAIQSLEEIRQYRAIGTVEELQALKEKGVAKKAIVSTKNHESYCPNCKEVLTDDEFWALDMSVTHCENCGQAVQGTEYVD